MLTDALSGGGLNIPVIEGPGADDLLAQMNPGSSVTNPIDFLATGTATQLGTIIDYCEERFDHIDAMVVIFGSPGLFDVTEVYELLRGKMRSCHKPIYPVLPSVINARTGIEAFRAAGQACFTDEVVLARALCTVSSTPQPAPASSSQPEVDTEQIRAVIDPANDGFLSPIEVGALLDAAGIQRQDEQVVTVSASIDRPERPFAFPVAMKVIGPVHKSDVGGVVLDVGSTEEMHRHFDSLMQIEGATGVLVQTMASGTELFAGLKRATGFGHLVVCGLGGVLIEVVGDFTSCLAPVSGEEARRMIRGLRGYPVIEGSRGNEGVSESLFAGIIRRLSALVGAAPEIAEMDINPLMGSGRELLAVDTRIKIEKTIEHRAFY
jgi:acetyltransferase